MLLRVLAKSEMICCGLSSMISGVCRNFAVTVCMCDPKTARGILSYIWNPSAALMPPFGHWTKSYTKLTENVKINLAERTRVGCLRIQSPIKARPTPKYPYAAPQSAEYKSCARERSSLPTPLSWSDAMWWPLYRFHPSFCYFSSALSSFVLVDISKDVLPIAEHLTLMPPAL